MLVHGGMCTAACWDPVLPHLTMPVFAVDLPGRASRPADLAAVTLDDCVHAVIDSADQAGFDQFVLVGHSLGGVTVTETAWRHPRRVTRLIYVGALVPGPGQGGLLVQSGTDWPPGKLLTIEEGIAKAIFGNDHTDEQWEETWRGFVPEAPGIANARLSGYPDSMPITYISLTDDAAVPPALAEQMITNLGAAVDHRTLSAGHMVMMTKPQQLAAIINDIADRADSTADPEPTTSRGSFQ